MPYQDHLKLTVRGTFGPDAAPFEEWSWGVNFSQPPATSVGFGQGMLDDLVADVTAFHTDPVSYMVASSRIREIKVAEIGPDGKYRSEPMIAAVNVPGGQPGATLPHPPQVALAVSLNTERRGPRGRGRFYLPCPALSVSADGVVPEVDLAKLRGRVKTLLLNLNNWPDIEANAPRVVVASSIAGNASVTGFRLGAALDTIRSRRRSLDESYGPPVAVG